MGHSNDEKWKYISLNKKFVNAFTIYKSYVKGSVKNKYMKIPFTYFQRELETFEEKEITFENLKMLFDHLLGNIHSLFSIFLNFVTY